MEPGNWTALQEFMLLGIPEEACVVFLFIFLLILLGNLSIFAIIRIDSHLHTPMYFFISNLSLLDICYSTTTLPILLSNCMTGVSIISFHRCIAQMYFFVSLGGAECLLLAVMAYDRYAAICNPLRYSIVMSPMRCYQLAIACWISAFLNSILHTVMTSGLSFCGVIHLQHFFCDVPPLLKLSCTDTHTSKNLLYVVSIFLGVSPFLYIVISYVRIISSILKISSAEGRRKAFSTCSAHLIVVTIFYGTANFNYIGPRSGYPLEVESVSSLLYCLLTPLLNPIIYCLRNKEVKGALSKLFKKKCFMGWH
ncbi:olfactory receptor 5V1-like [Ambystoma mexicanum]|uniref:olfactory receptor 5V1-like n=1 Tax=Ambystoma mexicanum TaxID=8296 RepID=UPI0037E8D973